MNGLINQVLSEIMLKLKKLVWIPLVLMGASAFAEECSYENNATHLDLSRCLNDEYQRTDDALTQKLAEMKQLSQTNMAGLKKINPKDTPNLPQQLDQAYQAFKQYREQGCLWVANMYLPGNGGGVASLQCMINLTRRYMDTLDSLQIHDMVD